MVRVHNLPLYMTLTLVAGTWIMCAILNYTMVVMIMTMNVFQSFNKWSEYTFTYFHQNFDPYV
jgi:hypothetical protein